MEITIYLNETEYQDILACAEERGESPQTLMWRATMDDLAR